MGHFRSWYQFYHYFNYIILLNTSVNQSDSIAFDKNGVCFTIPTASLEDSSKFWIFSTGKSAITDKSKNKVKYTSIKPKNAPNPLLTNFNSGSLATKSNIEAIICKITFVAKNTIIKAIAL